MKTKVVSEEVSYVDEAIVKVDREDLERLKEQMHLAGRQRIRLCAHRSPEDKVHDMLIIHEKDVYIRPHKHLCRTESFHVIEGVVDVIVYQDHRSISDVIPMGPYGSGRQFFYRFSEPFFHTMRIISDYVIFHETTSGPFKRSDTVYAPWAPDQNDEVAKQQFLTDLPKAIERFRASSKSARALK